MNAINTLTTHGVTISVATYFIPEQSSFATQNFVFAYKIHIKNKNSFPVKLLWRHWRIVDAFMDERRVSGLGVVGEQPVIYPGETYSYVSGCHFVTPMGKMSGYYRMMNAETKEEFRVTIPDFCMFVPSQLN